MVQDPFCVLLWTIPYYRLLLSYCVKCPLPGHFCMNTECKVCLSFLKFCWQDYITWNTYPWQFHRIYIYTSTVYTLCEISLTISQIIYCTVYSIYTLCEISLTISLNIYIQYIYLMWNITEYIYIPYVKYPWQFHWIYIYSIYILCEISLNIYIYLMWNIPDNFTDYVYSIYLMWNIPDNSTLVETATEGQAGERPE